MRLYLKVVIIITFSGVYSLAQEMYGEKVDISPVVKAYTAELMQHWVNQWPPEFKKRNKSLGLEEPNRENLPQAPGALELPQWPVLENPYEPTGDAPQTLGISFTGATLSDAGAFPPDVMGDVGPTQYVVFVNGRLRTFNKTTGVADGVINADPDAFFSLIMTPPGTGQVTYTSDPNVRYDRLSGHWFLTIIDVTLVQATGAIAVPNRLLIAWSDGSIITSGTLWTFTYYQNPTYFDDYPSLGVDANALYIGTDKFTIAGSFNNTKAYVFNKASLISGSPTLYIFDNLLASTTSPGPFAPRGVDNYDPNNTGPSALGYFIGVDNAAYSTLMLRRVTNPGGSPPTMSTNISIAVLTTRYPITVRHQGNTGGSNGYLDALDDRLYAAHLRNGSLWTSHNIGVRNNGVSSTISNSRNAARWYEINNLSTTPTIVQTGTLYDNSSTATNLDQRNYWIPTIMVSGQGHAALGCSIAGTNERINGFTTGRLVGDALGTLRDGPGGTTFPGYTASTTAYNPPSDPGGTAGRRWGDYSFTSIDPNDDMTMWTAQEFCSSSNNWGVRVVQLLAPPPVTPTLCTPSAIPNQISVNVVVTGAVVNGSGFFDPGTGFPNHISASLPGGIVVNSATFNSPTQVTLNLNTTGVADGFYTVTITNPDGQSATSLSGILQIDHNLPVELSSFTAKVLKSGGVQLNWRTETEVSNYGFEIERLQDYPASGKKLQDWEKIGFVEGHGNSNSPKDYTFADNDAQYGKYAYRLKQIDTDGQFEYSKVIEVNAGNIPDGFVLEQNYPNPFNPTTTIKFALAETQNAELKVFDILGNEVVTLFNGIADGGKVYEVEFDIHSGEGRNLSSGLYFYRLATDNRVKTGKCCSSNSTL